MEVLLNAKQSKMADLHAMNEMHIPSLVLMERASMSIAGHIFEKYGIQTRILVVCGTGNNGGDGVAISRMLYEAGYSPEILLLGSKEKYSLQLNQQLEMIQYYKPKYVKDITVDYDLIIDALFGFGLTRNVEGVFAEAIQKINKNPASVIAVDIPSGIHTDTGTVMGCAVKADLTIALSSGKPGLFLDPGRLYCGEVIIEKIGIPIKEAFETEPPIYMLEKEDMTSIANRDESGNKGSFSKVLVIAGSAKMFGAAYLSAMAALRSGAGMVKVFTTENNRTALATLMPEALISCYSYENPDISVLKKEIDWADVSLIGPGLDQNATSKLLVQNFLMYNTKPFVMDADALNIIAQDCSLWDYVHEECIITPHMGEMGRLTNMSIDVLKQNPITAARAFAATHKLTCILKDARSVIASADGTAWINVSGNSALATAGSGDVLAGIVAGLLGQKTKNVIEGIDIAAAASFIHGCCGEYASENKSKASVTARDLLEYLF